MGGGGMMRAAAAAKVAGCTVANHGRRVLNSDHHHAPVSSSIRSAHPLDDIKLVSSQKESVSEIDECVIPRVVFRGGAPSLQEAKEATSQLADALDKAYLSSPNSVGHDGLSTVDNSALSNSQEVENKAWVTSEIVRRPSAPYMKAFKLLHGSSMAQNVVASIACDPHVWNAVMNNQQLEEFLHSQRTPEYGGPADVDVHDESSSKSSFNSSGYSNLVMDFVEKIKSTVVDMMSKMSSFFNKVFTNSDGTARVSADTVLEGSFMGGSLMGLAIMAIMVIVLKRG